MTESKAVENIISMKAEIQYESNDIKQMKRIKCDSLNIALKALEEIQQYRVIGTVEECQYARERQMPKKTGEPYMNGYGNTKAECLNCHCIVMHPSNYCKFCGQKLDWSE